MGQKKLQRFAEILEFENVLTYPENMQGNWKDFFKNENPLTLELACGKGEYATGLGRIYPQRNFIGIDLKGNRIWVGAKTALDEGLSNVAFIRSHIDKVNNYFAKDEVEEIWITFPDPQLRNSKMKKRLTHPRYLRLYQQFLKPDGIIHLKTDSPNLYHFTKTVIEVFNLECVEDNDNVYAGENIHPDLQIKTHYEKMDIAGKNTIHHLAFKINNSLLGELDEVLKNKFIDENNHTV